MKDSQVGVLALGATLGLATLGALLKSAPLRGDTYAKLSDRVTIAQSGLSELARRKLRELQERIDEHLGDPDAFFDPAFVIADPGELVVMTRKFEEAIRVRDKLEARFRHLLFVCKWVWVPLLVMLVGIAAGTYLLVADQKSCLWRSVAFGFTGSGLVVSFAALAAFMYLHAKITTAEILGNPNGDEG